MNQVMLQVPSAAQDSFGQLHIRGDHNGLQFRLNGVILPDGISFFGQTLPPRMIDQFKLITGSLPAEYGLRSAGIIDITTKSGALQPGGEVSLYGGSHGCDRAERQLRRQRGQQQLFPHRRLPRATTSASSRPMAAARHCTITPSSSTASATSSTSSTTATASPLIAGTSVDRFQIPNLRGLHSQDVAPAAHRRRRDQLPQRRSRREPARDHPFRRAQPAALERRAHRADLTRGALLEPRLLPGPEPRRPAVQRHLAERLQARRRLRPAERCGLQAQRRPHRARRPVRADRPPHQRHQRPRCCRPTRSPAGRSTTCRAGIVGRQPARPSGSRASTCRTNGASTTALDGELRAALRSLFRVLAAAASSVRA